MKVFELKKRKDLSHAIHAIALVEKPAIEEDFIYLSKDQKTNIFLSEEKGIIYSPVLIPNQRIKRLNQNTGEEYEIFFSKETIEEAAYDMMKAKSLDNFNSEHTDNKLNSTNIVELWIVEDPKMDKSTKLGFNVPGGTMMAGIKVEDESVKSDIKLGKYKGISIEGLFEDFELVEDTNLKSNITMSKVESTIKDLYTKLKAMYEPMPETKLASIETDKGTLYADSFREGVKVFSDEAMTMPASAGEYIKGEVKYVITESGELGALESVQSMEPAMPEDAMRMAEENAKATLSLNEKVKSLEAENVSLKKENEGFKTELSEMKEVVEKHKVLLSKLEQAEPQSRVELKQEVVEVDAFTKLSNRARNY